jgi:hypothetical protein
MTRRRSSITPDISADPFGERAFVPKKSLQILGARFEFATESQELMRLVESAYAGLPRHRIAPPAPQLHVRIIATSGRESGRSSQPPPLEMYSAAGILGGVAGPSDFVAVFAEQGAAVIGISPAQLRFPYHTRYEVIEFAVFTLAARAQRLVPLHGACVSQRGRGVLLVGDSGAGKTTAALHCLLEGLDFVSEDSVFVAPETLLATGVANYLHVRSDSLAWLEGSPAARAIRAAPIIERRSGVRKFEVDLRHGGYRLARSAPRLDAVVFLSGEPAGKRPLLTRLASRGIGRRLAGLQPYARGRPEWPEFAANISGLRAFELRRGSHPREAVAAVREVLSG